MIKKVRNCYFLINPYPVNITINLFLACDADTVHTNGNDDAVVVVTITEDVGDEDGLPLEAIKKEQNN